MSPARIPTAANIRFFEWFHRDCDSFCPRLQTVWQCDPLAPTDGDWREAKPRSPPSRHICCQPLVTTGCGYLPTGYLRTGYLPTGYLPIGAAAGGGGSLRGTGTALQVLVIIGEHFLSGDGNWRRPRSSPAPPRGRVGARAPDQTNTGGHGPHAPAAD